MSRPSADGGRLALNEQRGSHVGHGRCRARSGKEQPLRAFDAATRGRARPQSEWRSNRPTPSSRCGATASARPRWPTSVVRGRPLHRAVGPHRCRSGGRCPGAVRQQWQMPAVDVHVPGLAVRRRNPTTPPCGPRPAWNCCTASRCCGTTSWTIHHLRRGRPPRTSSSATGNAERGCPGSAWRFGASAAILLSDLCLVWAEQMMRESGCRPRRCRGPGAATTRCGSNWPSASSPTSPTMPGRCPPRRGARRGPPQVRQLHRAAGPGDRRRHGPAATTWSTCSGPTGAGRAFQLRDDLWGVRRATVTGKPVGGDLAERKATSVVVAAHQMADSTIRRQFVELMNAEELTDDDIAHWRNHRGHRRGGVGRGHDRRSGHRPRPHL